MWSCCPCYASASDYTLARAPTSDMLDTAFNAEDDSDEDEDDSDVEFDEDALLLMRQRMDAMKEAVKVHALN